MGNNKRHFKGSSSSDAKRQRKEKEEAWKNTRGDDRDANQRSEIVQTNDKFEAFYRAQHMVSDEEFDTVLHALRQPLPACFRINSDYEFADSLREQLLQFAGNKTVIDGKEVAGVEQMPWYPGGYAYKLGYDRRTIRKNEELTGLHQWMIRHTDNGNITRQEAVSMVPPIALNVEPHHRCLDMCAAPGSKTSQLLEIVTRSLTQQTQALSSDPPQLGVVVANDADTDRAYMLVHQCRRLNSPLLVVTTHQGQLFPSVDDVTAGAGTRKQRVEYFDRILCDVPCSGDGTLRKNPAIWGKWSTDSSVTLHPLQLSIACRGIQLLRTGGLLVFSTCSMSPYENEAVVAELLRTHKGVVELVDARQFIPGFKARPGLTAWPVLNDFGVKFQRKRDKKEQKRAGDAVDGSLETTEDGDAADESESPAGDTVAIESKMDEEEVGEKGMESVVSSEPPVASTGDADLDRCIRMGMSYYAAFEQVPERDRRKFKATLFSPSPEELEWMHLERCLRCLPHDEDTGGFFVATLRKCVVPVEVEPETFEPLQMVTETEVPLKEESTEALVEVDQKKKPYSKGLVEFTNWDPESFQTVQAFYGLAPSISADNFYARKESSNGPVNGPVKSVYFVPSSVRDLLRGDRDGKLKVVALGVKVFERKDHDRGHEYRLLQEGLQAIYPFVTKRKVRVPIQDFCNMLGGGLTSFSTLSAPAVLALSSLQPGVFVCSYSFQPEDVVDDTDAAVLAAAKGKEFAVVCYRGNGRTVNVMCGKVDISRIRHQLEALHVFREKVLSTKKPEAAEEGSKYEGLGSKSDGVVEVNDSAQCGDTET